MADATITVRGSLDDLNLALDGLVYTPNAGFNGIDVLSVTTDDLGSTGSPGALQDIDTVQITVGNANAPTIDLDPDDSSGATGADYATTWTEGFVQIIADTDATIVDTDENLVSVTVTITNLLDGADETLSAPDTGGTNITAIYSGGTLTLSGVDTAANYQQVLRSVRYHNDSDDPTTTARVITFTATDSLSNGNTATATVAIAPVNDAPVNIVPADQTTDQDVPIAFSTGEGNAVLVGDADAGAGSIDVTLSVLNGTLSVDDGSVGKWGTESTANQETTGFQYAPDVAYAPDGSFWMTWYGSNIDGDGYGIVARHFAADGRPLTDEIAINTTTAGNQEDPDIAVDSAMAMYSSSGRTRAGADGDTNGVYAQRLDATGAFIGTEFLVNTTTSGGQAASARSGS